MKNYSQVIEIYKGLVGGNATREEAIAEIDKSVDIKGMWNTAHDVYALDENRSCEDFAIAHMTAYNNAFGGKY
jgi:hypothetical protein